MFRKGSTLVRQESTMIPSGPSERSDPDVRTPIAVSTTAIDKRVSGPSDDGERAAPTQDGVDLTSTVSGETGAPAHDQSKPNEVEGKHDIADIVQKRGKRQKKIRPFDGSTGEVVVLHEDIIGDRFWFDRPWLLA
jgi:tRNA(His) guanylyltransferase